MTDYLSTPERVARVEDSDIAVRAAQPAIRDITIRRVRRDFWAGLQRTVALMIARRRPAKQAILHEGNEQSRHVFTALAAFVAAHERSDRMIQGLAKAGAAANRTIKPGDDDATAKVVAKLLDQHSPLVREARAAAKKPAPQPQSTGGAS